jgi:hypothetical protein
VLISRRFFASHNIFVFPDPSFSESLTRTLQLEVLDTAGAEQFTSLNEVYIKVRRIS